VSMLGLFTTIVKSPQNVETWCLLKYKGYAAGIGRSGTPRKTGSS